VAHTDPPSWILRGEKVKGEAGGRRQEAGGRRQEAGGRAGGVTVREAAAHVVN